MISKRFDRFHFYSGKSDQWGIEISYWQQEFTIMIIHWYFIFGWIPREDWHD